ncbi:MAG: hypothetical protein ACFCUQ_16985 [Kiloniellales bacterium]
MHRISQRTGVSLRCLAVALVASILPHHKAAAEEQIIDAFATWEGQGVIYETGEKLGTFVGSIAGPLFIDTDKGPINAGRIVCPVLLDVDLETAKQAGRGKCTVTADDGARAFGDWSCQGVHLIGCDGELTLTGGTGRLAGISGKGEIRVRSTVRAGAAKASTEGSVMEFGSGILVLRHMKLELPAE